MEIITFRELQVNDIEDTFSVRSRTRQNPISRGRLVDAGITPESIEAAINSGKLKGWGCLHDSTLIGFCIGNRATGEVLVLAVVSDFEGKGLGAQLLSRVIEWLSSAGIEQPWLAASPNEHIRAHGFYRALGWQPTGKTLDNGDEILMLNPQNM
jgi:GNAT superfamily N-acetyltransferase